MKIAKNTVVSLRYELFDADGELIEKVEDPVSYLHGGYDGIFPLVEEILQDKQAGDSCTVEMKADEAFGDYDHSLVAVEKRDLFPEELEIGMQFEGGPEGAGDDEYLLFTVVEIDGDEVTVDGNHPLAGKALKFVCTVSDVRAATDDELSHGHVHGEEGEHQVH